MKTRLYLSAESKQRETRQHIPFENDTLRQMHAGTAEESVNKNNKIIFNARDVGARSQSNFMVGVTAEMSIAVRRARLHTPLWYSIHDLCVILLRS